MPNSASEQNTHIYTLTIYTCHLVVHTIHTHIFTHTHNKQMHTPTYNYTYTHSHSQYTDKPYPKRIQNVNVFTFLMVNFQYEPR